MPALPGIGGLGGIGGGNTINIALLVNGNINASFTRTMTAVQQRLIQVQNQANITSTAINRVAGGGGGGYGPRAPRTPYVRRSYNRGIRMPYSRGFQFGGLGYGLLGGGLFAGLTAFAGINNLIQQSIKLTKEQQSATMLLNTQLQSELAFHHQNVNLANAQTQALVQQAKLLQEQTGQYQNVYIRGAATLANAQLTAKQIQQMQPYMAKLVVANRLMGRDSANMGAVYEAVAKSIVGMGRNLLTVGIKLDPIVRKIMVMQGSMRNWQANINIIEEAITRQFSAIVGPYMAGILGQYDVAMVRIKESYRALGRGFQILQYEATILYSRILQIFTPVLMKAVDAFNQSLGQMIIWLDKNREALKSLLAQGWSKFLLTMDWFHRNSGWITPLFKTWVALFVTWKVGTLSLGVALWALSPAIAAVNLALRAGPVGQALLLAGAAYLVITNWNKVKDWFKNFEEWMLGTKVVNFQKFERFRQHKQDPKEPGVQAGWYNTFIQAFVRWESGVEKRLPKWLEKWTPIIIGWIGDTWNIADKIVETKLDKFFKDQRDMWQRLGTTVADALLAPFKKVDEFLLKWAPWLGSKGFDAMFPQNGSPGPGGTAWMPPGTGSSGVGRLPDPLPNAQGYKTYKEYVEEGPSSNYGTYGPNRHHLILGKGIGLGPNIMKDYGLFPGDWVRLPPPYGWRQVNESSSRGHGVEMYMHRGSQLDKTFPDRLKILDVIHQKARKGIPADESSINNGNPNITINSNPTYHVHGDSSHTALAEAHRQHIEDLKKHMEEVHYRLSRQSFVNRAFA